MDSKKQVQHRSSSIAKHEYFWSHSLFVPGYTSLEGVFLVGIEKKPLDLQYSASKYYKLRLNL